MYTRKSTLLIYYHMCTNVIYFKRIIIYVENITQFNECTTNNTVHIRGSVLITQHLTQLVMHDKDVQLQTENDKK